MGIVQGRLERERKTMECMVAIYCADHHPVGKPICTECATFLAYTTKRLEKCPYGAAKPTCARCPIHCYKRAQRDQAKEVMRHAGPRMLHRHPWLTLCHMADKLRHVEHPMIERRKRRSDAS